MTPKLLAKAVVRRRIRSRLLMPALIVAACFAAMAIYRNVQLRRAQEALQKASALQLANIGARTLDATIAETHTLLVSIAALFDPGLPTARNDAVLERIFRAAPVPYANLWIADTLGRPLGAARTPPPGQPGFSIADRGYFRDAMATRRFTVGRVVESRILPGNPHVLTFAMPVIDSLSGRIKAVVGASIEVDSLEAVRTARLLPEGSVLAIIDSTGQIVYRTLDTKNWIGRRFDVAKGELDDFFVGEGVGSGRSSDGTFRLTGFRRTRLAPWVLYVGIPLRYTLDIVRNQFLRDLAIGAITTLVVLLFGYWSADRVVTPIESLTSDARAIADGNMARRSAVDSNDEIGELARAFNQMADTVVERNAALKSSQEQLLHVQKMDALGSFAGGIAHDFNNYLASIVAHTELADLALADDHPARADLQEVLASASRAADLTRQILVFSRKQMVELRALDLNNVVRGIERMLVRLSGENRRLDVVYAGEPVVVHADHGQLEQVIVNLVANARDAMPDGGVITLRVDCAQFTGIDARIPAQSPGAYASLSVTDEGTGISAELLDRIFDPFFSTKERGRGTGLGLAIAYSIIEQSGGTLSVSSMPGTGTTFTATLPLTDDDCAPGPMTNGERAARRLSSGSGRILLAEDDPAVRSSCERILTHAGYDVTAAADGPAALALLRGSTDRFDLLLSDVVMPGMSGSVLARLVKEHQSDIGVLFMSGYADDTLVHDEIAASAVTCIAKPFSVREICDAVERAIATRVGTLSA